MENLETYKLKGYLLVECKDKFGNVIDKYENHNLIMDAARISMAQMTAGLSNSSEINKFVLGTEGHIGGDYLNPKTDVDGFVGTRTKLFSEQSGTYNYPIVFDTPGTATGSCTIVSEPDADSTVSIVYADKSVEYTIEVFEDSANNTGVAVFTEAALYAGANIFSMKCFPGKIKDNTVSLKIVWKILF